MSSKEWKEVTLGDQIVHKKGFAFKSTDINKDGHPIVRVTNFTGDSINMDECFFISKDEANKYLDYTIFHNDIIIATVGSWPNNPNSIVGKVIKVPKNAEGALLNQNSVILRGKAGINQLFLYYRLRCKDFSDYLISGARGSANQASISLVDIFKFKFNLPDLNIQTKIASILSSLDDKIELNRQTNQTLEGIAQTLFQEMCVPKVEELPEGWRVGVLFDICKLIGGGTPKTSNKEYWDNGTVDWISAKDITPNNGSFITQTEKRITELGLKNSSAKLLPSLATIISARGTVGNVCIISKPMTISQSNYAFVASTPQTEYYLFCIVRSLVNELKQRAYGTIFDTITTTSLSDLEVITPTKDILKNFNNIISPIFEQIRTNIQENQTLIALRDSLLPKLMKGEIEI